MARRGVVTSPGIQTTHLDQPSTHHIGDRNRKTHYRCYTAHHRSGDQDLCSREKGNPVNGWPEAILKLGCVVVVAFAVIAIVAIVRARAEDVPEVLASLALLLAFVRGQQLRRRLRRLVRNLMIDPKDQKPRSDNEMDQHGTHSDEAHGPRH